MAVSIEIENLQKLITDHATKKLKDAPLELVKDAGVKADHRFTTRTTPKVAFGIEARAKAHISAFNGADDTDVDGILGDKDAEQDSPTAFPQQVDLNASAAWLKYRFDAGIKGTAAASLNQLGFNFDADKQLVVADYRKHAPDDVVLSSIVADLSQPRFIVRRDDIRALEAGEALSMQFVGSINAGVRMAWADVFSTEFGNLGTVLNTDDVIPLKFSSGASFSASVSIKDDFIIAMSRAGANKYRVAVRKAKNRRSDLTFDAKAEVKLADPKAFEKAVNAVIEAYVDAPIARVEALVKENTVGRLSDTQRKLLDKLLEKFDLDAAIPAPLKEIKAAYENLRAEIDKRVQQVANAKVSAAFKYEYSRISTSTSLLQATFTDDLLDRHHGNLIKGNLALFLDDISADKPGVALEVYLNHKTLAVSKAWGFTLGIGPWSFYGKDRSVVNQTVDENIDGQKRIALRGLRSYEGKWIGEKFGWSFDFKADMEGFSSGPWPRFRDYDYGIALIWNRTEELDDRILRRVVDTCTMWRVCAPQSITTISDAVQGSFGKQCEITIQMKLDHELIKTLLPELGSAGLDDFSAPLAAAMPWMDDYAGRRTVQVRRRLYKPLWDYYFANPTARPSQLARRAEDYFLAMHGEHRELRVLEKKWDFREALTFAGLVRLNGSTIVSIEQFLQGMRSLHEGWAANDEDRGRLLKIASQAHQFAEQSHHVRALGAYLSDLAVVHQAWAGVERTLTIDDGTESWVFGM